MTNKDKLYEIIKAMAISEEFRLDFMTDWGYVWQKIEEGSEEKLPDVVIDMCYKYTMDW